MLNTLRLWNIYRNRYLKYDFIAALIVFLVAIPLCLGIALASGAPLFSGIISGIIGGIIVGMLSGSHVSVSGPAAGMAAVVVAAMAQLGDFNSFLLALMLSGLIQIIIGSLRAGFVADYIPSNVIQGLLCAIGILLIVKQLPFTFTLSTDMAGLKNQLLDATQSLSLSPLYEIPSNLNLGATLIAIISFALLIYMEKSRIKILRDFPSAMAVVIVGILLNELFMITDSKLLQNIPNLVNIPRHNGWNDFLLQMQSPSWSAWTNPKVYLYAMIIAIIASLESLLNLSAGDKLDRKKRNSSKDRELVAQGTGNFLAGLLGGIPITSVIVRTSVNIQAGGQTKIVAILHGCFLLFAVMLIPNWLNKIPLSSLAAILIFTGYKLTKPSIYQSIYTQGKDRFIPFIVTVFSIVVFNLLAGIMIGLGISLFYILKSNSQARFDIIKEIYPDIITTRLVLPQQVSFLNKASLIAELSSLPSNSQLVVDARYTTYIDKEIIELIKEFQLEKAPLKQIRLELIGFKDHYTVHNFIDFINVTTYKLHTSLQPSEVLTLLREGNQRFLHDIRIHRSSTLDIKYTADGQHPMAVVLGCIDSRVPVETIFDMSFGDLFCIRVAGNVINDDILASMEYACHIMGARLILVLGHTRCGAIQAACDGVRQGHITQLLEKIKPALNAEVETVTDRSSKNAEFVAHVTALNIANTLNLIYTESEILKNLIDDDVIGIVGATYNVESGKVHFGNYALSSLPAENSNNQLKEKSYQLLQDANL